MVKSNWTGSETTSNLVRKQIANRFGAEEAEKYNPQQNCFTFKQWSENGYKVKKGEKAIKSFIVVEKKNEKGEVTDKYPRNINLFYIKQVEKATKKD